MVSDPLEYIGQEQFGINIHWSYYMRLSYMSYLRIFSRPVFERPYDRYPSDTWLCPTPGLAFPIVALITVLFSILLIGGWNFQFPTQTEKIMWRCTTQSR
ncbi:uncharacterized protein N7498_001356 [Penicillium cinerascens]|uniref:Uncharacterized protein n=1 Tax=Penicillium cinerascens TaxID=70096 RepID=A0A9W9TDW6_9EURO|nr:uncharacterized protein N7498_001356 [Penicillium cinerascens]KAJ5219257.1 hypothetical protein N7498_001356 [Penicillium cinerascens]